MMKFPQKKLIACVLLCAGGVIGTTFAGSGSQNSEPKSIENAKPTSTNAEVAPAQDPNLVIMTEPFDETLVLQIGNSDNPSTLFADYGVGIFDANMLDLLRCGEWSSASSSIVALTDSSAGSTSGGAGAGGAGQPASASAIGNNGLPRGGGVGGSSSGSSSNPAPRMALVGGALPGSEDQASDTSTTPVTAVPTPTAAAAGLACLAICGLRRRRDRASFRDQARPKARNA